MENLASEEKGDDAYTQDGTVSLHGSPVLRSKTGRWTACSFIVGYEVFERMAYYGIATNLVVYLGERLHEGTVQSSNNVTNWAGTVWILPILGAYIADARLGRFWTFVFASAIYLSGMILLTLAVSIPGLKPPRCPESDPGCNIQPSALQKGIFYLALYIIAIGTGGTKPNISTMGADQFDEFEPKERTHKLSFFNWWMFSIFFGTLFSNTFLIYLQDRVGWTLGYGLPTVGLGISIVVFLIGTPMYRHKLPVGSPFTKMAQVLAAAARNWNVELPDDPKELYELGPDEYEKLGKFPVDHSPSLSYLINFPLQVSRQSCSKNSHNNLTMAPNTSNPSGRNKANAKDAPNPSNHNTPKRHSSPIRNPIHQTRINNGQKHGPQFRNPSSLSSSIRHNIHANQLSHLRPLVRAFHQTLYGPKNGDRTNPPDLSHGIRLPSREKTARNRNPTQQITEARQSPTYHIHPDASVRSVGYCRLLHGSCEAGAVLRSGS
ncbi:Protein NRT1/ PTR FAMILY 5.2 [Linum perenne]